MYNMVEIKANQKFGKWTVISRDILKASKYWWCKCDCGKIISVNKYNLFAGKSSSCLNCRIQENRGIRHGMSKHRLYVTWCNMKDRCNNLNSLDYKNYGGRGISICERWNYFPNFAEDMDSTYQKGLTLERKDTNGNYILSNCIWIPKSEQSKNRRNVHKLEYRGKIYSQVELIALSGLPRGTIEGRMKLGWSIEETVNGKNK